MSHIIQNTIKQRAEELAYLKRDIAVFKKVEPPFERLSYSTAIDILKAKGFTFTEEDGGNREIRVGDDLNIDSERELTKDAGRPILSLGNHSQSSRFTSRKIRIARAWACRGHAARRALER